VIVRWNWGGGDIAADPHEIGASEVAEQLTSGTLNRLHDYVYGRLPQARLVLPGRPDPGT
jgi:hypothetical protein